MANGRGEASRGEKWREGAGALAERRGNLHRLFPHSSSIRFPETILRQSTVHNKHRV